MQILMLFCLIPFLKTNAVLDHLPESIKVKKKQQQQQQQQKHTHTRKHKKKTARSSVECWDHCAKIKTIAVVKIGLSPSVKSFYYLLQ